MSEANQPAQPPKRLFSVPCNGCGGQMAYDAATTQLKCPNCQSLQEIPTSAEQIIERSFSDALNLQDAHMGMETQVNTYSCKTCGAATMVASNEPITTCDFCASTNINQDAYERQVITPAGILPFIVTKDKAVGTFRSWIGTGWFRPSSLAKLASLTEMKGVYIPFWTYDADTDSDWHADAGYYYYETEYYNDENGNRQSRQVQRVRWVPASGFYQQFFDDVLVVGSKGIAQDRVQRVYPFSLSKLVDYDPQFMLGWRAEVYQLDVQKGFGVADEIMDQFLYNACAQQIPGDTHRNLHVNTHKYNITFKHILLPLWIAAYQYKDKVFQVIVNGETGEISGEKPWSWFKIILFSLAVMIVIFVLLMVFKR
jgi:ribosomal protein S27E/ribosomal protein L37AE/L43A